MFWRKHKFIKPVYNVLLEKKFEGTYIDKIAQVDNILKVHLHLPEHKDLDDLKKIMPNLQQELSATAVRIGKGTRGKRVVLEFGMRELKNVTWSKELLHPSSLKIEFPSAYGEHIVDFEDGASCHLLNGGVTRMGKTVFLLHVATTLYLQNKGNLQLYISSAKLKDYYPFDGCPNVYMSRDSNGLYKHLKRIIGEYQKRNDLLYSPSFRKAADAKGVRKHYPESYHLFQPVFLIIDEYARFADDEKVQEMITEIVETAGFVNIHVIIASQRPDAKNVLKPRIRANLLCRMAFTTADKKNSEIILDREGAEELGKIPGRGLLLDSDTHIVQVPYLDVVECDKLLEEYRNVKEPTRPNHTEEPREIQSHDSESVSIPDLQGQHEPESCSEPSAKAYDPTLLYHSDTEGTGQMLPIHAESDPNSPEKP